PGAGPVGFRRAWSGWATAAHRPAAVVGRPGTYRRCFDDDGHGCTRHRPVALYPGPGGDGSGGTDRRSDGAAPVGAARDDALALRPWHPRHHVLWPPSA